MTNNKKQTTNSGFTIVESLVAISILVMAVTGAMTATQTGISSYVSSKDQIIAINLAQEGVEQIKNIRDVNGLNDLDWLAGIASSGLDPCFFGNSCTVSPVETPATIACGLPGTCPMLRQDSVTGFFGYDSSWRETVFRREIVLTQINLHEVVIEVTVNWSKGIVNRQFKVKETMLNWQS